jgi:hypothetical protein
VPGDEIDEVIVIDRAFPCGDHEHPLILLRRKSPEPKELIAPLKDLLTPGTSTEPAVVRRLDDRRFREIAGASTLGAALTVFFGVDVIGSAASTVTVVATGHVVSAVAPMGGLMMFNVSQTQFGVPPLPHQYLSVSAAGLQPGTWCVWASSNISGGAGPCETRVPGSAYLGVDGGQGPHCGVAYAVGTRATLGTA